MQLAIRGLGAAALGLAATAGASAQETTRVQLRTHYFTQTDGTGNRGGNPDADEDFSVMEHVALVAWRPSRRVDATLRAVYEEIRTGNDQAVTSGASSQAHLDRKAAYLTTGYTAHAGADGSWRLGVSLGVSDERDRYRSMQGGVDFSQELLGRTLTWAVGASWFHDTVQVLRFDGTDEGAAAKDTLGAHASVSLVCSPSFVAGWYANYTHQRGLLERPGNFVTYRDAAGATAMAPDVLPERRHRFFTGLLGRYALDWWDGAAVEASVRFYADDFGIAAHGAQVRFRQQVATHLGLGLRYRLYSQAASRYWSDRTGGLPRFRTQDAASGEFVSQAVGVQVSVLDWDLGPVRAELDFSADWYERSDGIAGWFAGGGLQLGF